MTDKNEKGIISKLFSIFWEPSSTFKSLKQKTLWYDIITPLLLISLIGCITAPFILPITVETYRERIENSERLSDTQKEQALDRLERQTASTGSKILRNISIPISKGIQYTIIALVMWFAGNVILGGECKFIPVFAMTAYTSLVDIISTAVKVPLMVSKGTADVYTGLALFFEKSSTFSFRFMTQIDIFSLWKVFLLSIGLGVIYNLKTSKTFWVVMFFWISSAVIGALFGGLVKI